MPCLNHQAHKIPPDDRYFWPPRAVGVQEPETGVHSMLILTRCTNVFTEAQYPAQCSTSHRRDSLDVSSRYNCVLYNQHIVPQLAHQTWLIRVSLLDLKKFTELGTHTQFRSGESSSKLCNSEDVPFALPVGGQKNRTTPKFSFRATLLASRKKHGPHCPPLLWELLCPKCNTSSTRAWPSPSCYLLNGT